MKNAPKITGRLEFVQILLTDSKVLRKRYCATSEKHMS